MREAVGAERVDRRLDETCAVPVRPRGRGDHELDDLTVVRAGVLVLGRADGDHADHGTVLGRDEDPVRGEGRPGDRAVPHLGERGDVSLLVQAVQRMRGVGHEPVLDRGDIVRLAGECESYESGLVRVHRGEPTRSQTRVRAYESCWCRLIRARD